MFVFHIIYTFLPIYVWHVFYMYLFALELAFLLGVNMFLCFLSGGVGVVYTLSVPGGGCRLTAVCGQLCLQPPAHLASGHHGSHAAGPPVFYRYKQRKPQPYILV